MDTPRSKKTDRNTSSPARPNEKKTKLSKAKGTQKAVAKSNAASNSKAAKAKPARKKVSKVSQKMTTTPDERWNMIAVAAYYRAERRDFVPGYEHEDWFEAEREFEALLR